MSQVSTLHSENETITLFYQKLLAFIDASDLITKDIQRFAYGTDASFYRLVPELVVRINNQTQLVKLITLANELSVGLTFRAAGTSLSGQAITDSVLVILSTQWQNIDILNQGDLVKLQPGVIGAQANKALASYQRKIGPDPASINSCKIGGIAANNASGMCCGVKNNSYHTLKDIKLIFADGSVLDTSDPQSRQNYLATHKEQIHQLKQLALQIKQSPELLARVQHKYRLKNTTGYGINALIDFDDPIEMIGHLMIGSEGTLAFIADITYQTIKMKPYKMAGLFVFDSMTVACQLVEKLAKGSVDAVEILDSRALNSVTGSLQALIDFKQAKQQAQSSEQITALLIEFSADNADELAQIEQQLSQHINALTQHLLPSKAFTEDESTIAALWKIRKGMFPAVGANRKTGTTVVIEDIALPLDKLAEGVEQLHQLFKEYQYHEAIIFGHALAGNLHFVFTQSFDTQEEIDRYHHFMAAVSQMVAVDYQGSLKAEHGTGRNMAPFVELEWGTDLYQIMRAIKAIFDPKQILNAGVIINDDENCHIQHLKAMPQADELLDKCIECGFCEAVCPSTYLTLTPRQRIAVWRRIQQLEALAKQTPLTINDQQELASLRKDYQYFGIDSCAATGLCGQACPVGIDTGVFIKTLRSKAVEKSALKQKVGKTLANNFSTVTSVAKLGLNSIAGSEKLVGSKTVNSTFSLLNKLSCNSIPKWYHAWPAGAKNTHRQFKHFSSIDKVIYIPSCANRIFSADKNAQDQRSIQEVMYSVFAKANIQLEIPSKIANLCCGMPWASKGMNEIAGQKQQEFLQFILRMSEHGKYPVITDASPCALTLKQTSTNEELNQKIANVKIYELSEYVAKFLLDKLTLAPVNTPYMLHKTCSSIKMDQGVYLEQIARACCQEVIIPEKVNCCGFAGDKGFYQPELNKNALQFLPEQIPNNCAGGISNSRTCEIGLTEHSKLSYQSFIYLLDQVSKTNNK